MNLLGFEKLNSILRYCPETGNIFYRVTRGSRAQKGSLAGGINKADGYVQIVIARKLYRGHRIAWLLHYGKWPENSIDHIDGDRSNNRICNLREANGSENMQNQRKPPLHNSSGFLGVSFDKMRGKWKAVIQIHGKQKCIGRFDNPHDASEAYIKKKREMHPYCTI